MERPRGGNDNRRSDPRADLRRRVLVFRAGSQWEGETWNLSAGGALVSVPVDLEPGDQFAMGMHLDGALRQEAGLDYLHFQMEVLAVARPAEAGRAGLFRCRNVTDAGSDQHHRASAIVYRVLSSQDAA